MRSGGRIRLLWLALHDHDPRSPDAREVATRTRLLVALGVGIASGLFAGLAAARAGALPDFLYPLTAARLFLDGTDPYAAIRGEPGAAPPFNEPFFYPFTTVLGALPFTPLPVPVACGVFFGLSSAALAFLITRDGLWRLHLFASSSFVAAATLTQFSPLVMVMAFVPAAGFLATLKPNLGLALLVRRPTVRALAGCFLVGALSLVVLPTWPQRWLQALGSRNRGLEVHGVPLMQFGGFALLLSLLAWRRAAGRLLLAMSLVPQALFFYDQLPLWLVPRTRGESVLLTACSQLAFLLWYLLREEGESAVRSAYPYVIALVYLPALIIVLRERKRNIQAVS